MQPAQGNFDAATESLIDNYLRHRMTQEDANDFERRMETDRSLREEVLLRRDIIIGIKAAERNAIRRYLNDPTPVNARAMATNAGKSGSHRNWWLVAALAAAAAAAAAYFLL